MGSRQLGVLGFLQPIIERSARLPTPTRRHKSLRPGARKRDPGGGGRARRDLRWFFDCPGRRPAGGPKAGSIPPLACCSYSGQNARERWRPRVASIDEALASAQSEARRRDRERAACVAG